MSRHIVIRGKAPVEARSRAPYTVVLQLALTGLLLGALAGYIATLLAPAVYTSRAILLFSPAGDGPAITLGNEADRLLNNQRALISSDLVLGPAAAALGDVSAEALKDGLALGTESLTDILVLDFSAGSPIAAQSATQALVDAYLDERERHFRVTVLSEPSLPTETSGLAPTQVVALGGVTGALLGTALAFAWLRLPR